MPPSVCLFAAWFLAYGYGHMYAPNATHLVGTSFVSKSLRDPKLGLVSSLLLPPPSPQYWNEVLDLDGSILDEIWIEQHAHGPLV